MTIQKSELELFDFLNNMHSIVLPNNIKRDTFTTSKYLPLRVLDKDKLVFFLEHNISCKHEFNSDELSEFLILFDNTTLDELVSTLICVKIDNKDLFISKIHEFYKSNNYIENITYEENNMVGTMNLYEGINSNNILQIKFVQNKIHLKYLNNIIECTTDNILQEVEKYVTQHNIKVIFLFFNWHLDQINILINYLKSKQLFYKLRIFITIHDWPKVLSRFVPKGWVKWDDNKHKLDFNVHFIDSGHYDKSIYNDYFLNYFRNIFVKNINIRSNFCNNVFIKNQIDDNVINKVLLLGTLENCIYPERTTFYNYCLNNSNKTQFNSKVSYDEYIKISQLYISAFIGPVNWDYKWKRKGYKISCCLLTSKFFEYSALGLLLLVHDNIRDVVEHLGYKDNVSCIFTNESNYDEKVSFIIDNKNRALVDKIRKEGQNITINNFTENHAKSYFNMKLNDI